MRIRVALAAFTLAVAVVLTGACGPADSASHTGHAPASGAVRPGPHDDGPHPPLLTARQAPAIGPHAVRTAPTVDVLPGGSVKITGLDLHDGTLTHLPDGRYAIYGSMYACGYQWYVIGTNWCGFGVSVAPALSGPWSAPALLFSPTDIDPWSGLTWESECGTTSGQGCFNARMIQRIGWGSNDGVWILWFNSPLDYSRNHANSYNALGCNGPTGPCGPDAGAPHGSYAKPALSVCAANGDFSIVPAAALGQAPAIVCTMPSASGLSVEQLNQWGVGGTGVGESNIAGLSNVEAPGGWYDSDSQQYLITYSDPACGYCAGTGTGYATAGDLYSGWSAPGNVGFSAPATGRRLATGTSCGGQPRTVAGVDGHPWQVVDLWEGTRNETGAALVLAPLTYTPSTGVAGDGNLWKAAVSYPCA